jgi:5-formyltetrahydrofolate cyclo-ligase
MEFYDYAADALAEGSFGISEPQCGEPCRAEEIDLMIVPGVAFTASGDRLGRGKGYYDKYLSRKGFRAYCVGVCYAHQKVEQLPVEPHDRQMDEIVVGGE